MNNEHKYDDIINLPHHVSQRHPQLGCDSYAAQFSPFAALTGYDGVVAEVARTTDQRIELDEDAKARIDLQLQMKSRQSPPHILCRIRERAAAPTLRLKERLI